jgi:hypothetical protein
MDAFNGVCPLYVPDSLRESVHFVGESQFPNWSQVRPFEEVTVLELLACEFVHDGIHCVDACEWCFHQLVCLFFVCDGGWLILQWDVS